MDRVKQILNCENKLGEGPVWDNRSATLYWLDIEDPFLWSWRVDQGNPENTRLELAVGCLGLKTDGRLLAAATQGFAYLDPHTGELQPILTPPEKDPAVRFNDGAVGPDGGFWAGTLSDEPVNHLYRLAPDLLCEVKESWIRISNGIGWSPDCTRMYYTDSPMKRIDVFDYDRASASLSNRRTFIDTSEEPGFPDGLTVDSEGCVWSARWDGWKVTRYNPAGNVLLEVPVPVQRPTSCTFGGENLKDLFITSAWTGLPRDEVRHSSAGNLFRLQTHVTGQVEYLFGVPDKRL
ncbi:MAG: SMP-30/gluconolactonase/LRE family protein [Anaerolineales bacterium]|nr:SMP-30/gluconolactonase/LRE family protein [Anaerolineales bacterium]